MDTAQQNRGQVVPSRYIGWEKIGAGTYGVVFKAQDTQTGRWVAIKKLKPDQEDEGISSTTIREISLLKELTHRNIINLLDVNYSDNKLCLVFEYLDRDLSVYLSESNGLLHPQILKVCLI